jgi:acyl transferase domain-containing protein
MDLGLQPAVLLGHSIGEMAGATLADIFDLSTATRVVLDRVEHLALAPPGGMAAVAAAATEVEPYLTPGVDIAAINAPRQTVIAGTLEPLRATLDALYNAGYNWMTVRAQTPFHSRVLEPVVEATGPVLASVTTRPPRIPMISGYRAQLLSAAEATDPRYWARHPVDPVLLWPALQALAQYEPRVLVECGPGRGLTTTARRLPAVRSGRFQTLPLFGPSAPDPDREVEAFHHAAAALGLVVASTVR